MTPKKNIVRNPTYTLPDGSLIPSAGKEFTPKESRFIFWYTNPRTEAFMNSGRAAARAGYKGNATMQGYLLKQKPRIAKKIDELIIPVKEQLHEAVWRVLDLCRIRMFYDVSDFYRKAKMIIKIRGKEKEIDIYEVVPLDELTWAQSMCIDGIDFKGPHAMPHYKLPNRDKNFDLFMKCKKLLFPEKDSQEMNWKATAEIIREKSEPSPVTN